MSFITLDWETFYDSDYSLSKMTTEEYIRDPRFQVIGVGIKVDDGETKWYATDESIKQALSEIDWSSSALLAHNALFDGAILAWHYGIVPAFYYDTLSMARAIHGVDAGGSLKVLAERYKIGEKGTEVVRALGKRRENFTPYELSQYGEYCKNDTDLCYKLFAIFTQTFPASELDLIDLTLRMYIQPVFKLDDAMLVEKLEQERARKEAMLASIMDQLNCTTTEEVRKKLASNVKFAELLRSYGVFPPMKESLTTGKPTLALAKTDEGFLNLCKHHDPAVQQLCAVRLGTKSTIEESRIERFIGIGARNEGRLPIPLKYYGAHTGRFSGMDKINLQNLPTRDINKKTLKNSILPPEGHIVINADSSQIEARVLAWLAGQKNVVEAFATGRDIYCEDATKAFGRPITKADVTERFVGKTCLSADTQVLTRRGWIPIIDVLETDELWDGEEWIRHHGVSFMGLKPTISLYGLELTEDHEILTGHSKWETAQHVLTHSTAFQSALALATLPSLDMLSILPQIQINHGDGNRYVAAVDAAVNIGMLLTTYVQDAQQRVITALNEKLQINGGGSISLRYPMTYTDADSLTDCPLLSTGATHQVIGHTIIMEGGVFQSTQYGEKTTQNFFGMFNLLMDGIIQAIKWIGLIMIKGTYPEIYSLYPQKRTQVINEQSKNLKPVFDILNSGSRNRFTVMTDCGPIIVHNCRLGLGYGTGALKLQRTLELGGATLDLQVCKDFVTTWRMDNERIVLFWSVCEQALHSMLTWPRGAGPFPIGAYDDPTGGLFSAVVVSEDGFILPNGLTIRYPNMRLSNGKIVYDSRKGTIGIWGGSVTENLVQALARIIISEQMLKISKLYRVALTVHDSVVCVVPEDQKDQAVATISEIMSTNPTWAPGLPIACEIKTGLSYGEC